MHILVINDEEDLVDICRLILENAGYSTAALVQPTQRRLYEAIGEHPPDLILLDLMLGHLSAHQVCGWLRADPVAARVPVLIMSARFDAAAVARSLNAVALLPKPFTDDELVRAVESAARDASAGQNQRRDSAGAGTRRE
jgi:DNA-binding response OmpR family regulator